MSRLLAIYLNDHLAGSTAGLELARRAARSNRGSPYGEALERLAGEIHEDRETLLAIMRRLRVGTDRPKLAAAWSAEKLGRLKLNGKLVGYSPLSRLVELEGLILGVQGKLLMWQALEGHAGSEELERLRKRAQSQKRTLERLRRNAVAEALETPPRPHPVAPAR